MLNITHCRFGLLPMRVTNRHFLIFILAAFEMMTRDTMMTRASHPDLNTTLGPGEGGPPYRAGHQ
jgi:hypothetical protein